MSSTGFETFDSTIQKTNEILKDIERDFGWEERRNQSYSALRAVLHALRDRLTVEEAAELGAQLPMLVRGMFYEGWNPSIVPRRLDREEFLQEVRKEFPFSIEGEIDSVVEVVLTTLRKYISIGEAEDIISILPRDLADMLRPMLVGTSC